MAQEGRSLKGSAPLVIVAEISCNHHGSLTTARDLIDDAAVAGADAVKFQAWTPGTMCLDPEYRVRGGAWAGWRLVDLYERAYTPLEWLPELFGLARSLGLEPFASSFDVPALERVEALGPRWHKVASFELCDLRLVLAAAATGRPLILSTGMASLGEVETVCRAVRQKEPATEITLLHCVSGYPTPPERANLKRMNDLRAFAPRVGLSDHSRTLAVPVAAAALGAEMIEAHITLERSGGLDDGFSLLPAEFAEMAKAARQAAAAAQASDQSEAEATQLPLRRSLHASRDMPAGHTIRDEDIVTARPATGVHPFQFARIVGGKLQRAISKGEPITLDLMY